MGSAVLLGLLCYLSLKYYTKTKAVCKPTVFLSLGKYNPCSGAGVRQVEACVRCNICFSWPSAQLRASPL